MNEYFSELRSSQSNDLDVGPSFVDCSLVVYGTRTAGF